jgi:MFS family permease
MVNINKYKHLYSLAHGGFFTAISPIVAEFFGISAHGALFGIVAFGGTAGGAMGPFLAGYIFDITGSYSPVFWLCTLISALGVVLILFLRPIKRIQGIQGK